jgi:peroxiredoxin
MAQLEPLKADIAAAGAELAYIAAEKRNGMFKPAKYLEKNPVSYPFLLDEERTATRAYGLYHGLGIDALNIAHPATIVIDQQRSVRYIYRGDNQHDRAPMDPVLAVVRDVRRIVMAQPK